MNSQKRPPERSVVPGALVLREVFLPLCHFPLQPALARIRGGGKGQLETTANTIGFVGVPCVLCQSHPARSGLQRGGRQKPLDHRRKSNYTPPSNSMQGGVFRMHSITQLSGSLSH